VDACHGRQEAWIRDAQRASASVVMGNVLQEPLDCIVGIGGLVHAFRIDRVAKRSLHDELALAAVPPADILKDEDVSVRGEKAVIVADHGVACDSVRRSGEEKREWRAAISRFADAGVERHPVSHRDLYEAASMGRRRRTLSPDRRTEHEHCRYQSEYEVSRQSWSPGKHHCRRCTDRVSTGAKGRGSMGRQETPFCTCP
jgi:hypothetical protein